MHREFDFFCTRLQTLKDLRGKEVVDTWCQAARDGHVRDVVRQLLEDHYDPGYANSTHRNYAQFNQALAVTVEDISLTALKTVAQRLMSLVTQPK